MIIEATGAHLGKHDAEEAQFGGAAKKQRWETSKPSPTEESQAQELLAWELEQEHWTDKSDAAILEDPHWQRVGIGRTQSTSPYSEDERAVTPGGQSQVPKAKSSTFPEASRPPMSPVAPARSFSQTGPDSIFLEDQRTAQQPLSPGIMVQDQRTVQQPMSPGMSVRSSHLLEAALSPTQTPRASSPSPSVRSTSSVGRYTSPEPNYLFSPQSQHASVAVSMQASESQIKVFGHETLGMRVRSFSPPAIILQSSSMSGHYPYGGSTSSQFRVEETIQQDHEIQTRIASAYHQTTVPRSASWNAQTALSQQAEADELEAEFARLESGRGRNLGFPGVPSLEERDEQDAKRSIQSQKMGYELEELEQEFERLEIRNKETRPVFLENVPSKEVIHLEDQASLGDDDVKAQKPVSANAVGVEELKAEFDQAVRRKETLLRDPSMDSNEGDEFLGETDVKVVPKEEPQKERTIPIRKSRWQEKLERFERKGLADAEANLDVSKYPRLQQIRQRRRERLKALMTIRQERAEIWNTLEANWEHMENSMARRLATDPTGKNRGQDPEPTSPISVNHADSNQDAKDVESNADSLKLSASESSMNETNGSKGQGKAAAPSEPDASVNLGKESPASEAGVEAIASPGNGDPVLSVADIVDDLVGDIIAGNAAEDNSSPAADGDDRGTPDDLERAISPKTVVASVERAVSPTSLASPKTPLSPGTLPVSPKTPVKTNDAIPVSTRTLLESISGATSANKNKSTEKDAEEPQVARVEPAKTSVQKEDPPPSQSFGAYISQNMSDVGTQVVKILKSVRSTEEQQPAVTAQGTDTNDGVETHEEDTSQMASPLTDEARDDDETTASNGLGLDLVGYEEEDPELEQQGCVNPLQNLIGNRRRIVVEDVAGQGCINPLVHFGFGSGASQLCNPIAGLRMRGRKGKAQAPEYIAPLPSASGSDLQDDTRRLARNQSDDDQKSEGSRSHGEDRDGAQVLPIRSTVLTSRVLTSKKAKRSKKGKHKKNDGGVDTFFTLVDDLLVNNILNIVDEKVVDNVAHTFGFD